MVEAAAAEFLQMLKDAPPTRNGVRVNLTESDLNIVTEAMAELYVGLVQQALTKWHGAQPECGISWGMIWEAYGFERSDAEIARAPVCIDWCIHMCEYQRLLSVTDVELSIGLTRLLNLVEVKMCQDWYVVGEHNYPIVHPAGQPPLKSYRILDAFPDIQPDVGEMGKYGVDLIAVPNANLPVLRRQAKRMNRLLSAVGRKAVRRAVERVATGWYAP